MERTLKEDTMMIARNILSGNNACQTLRKAVDGNDVAYFAAAADAVLRVKREEIEHVREQRDMARNDVEKYRFALEIVVQNMIPAGPHSSGMLLPENGNIHTILEKTLGRTLSWNTG